jgi:hypothetical protein
MALGFAPALLTHLQGLMQANYSGIKITPSGFLKAAIEHNPTLRVASVDGQGLTGPGMKISTGRGHIKNVTVKYLPRITPSQVVTEDNCENDIGFQYTESTIAAPSFAKLGFQLEWGFVEAYEEAASNPANIGVPSTGVLKELEDQLMHCVNGLINKIDQDLLAQVAFGTNVVTGDALPKNININKDGSVFDLSDGVTEIISDAQENEFVGDLILVGNGLFNKYEIARGAGAIGLNGAGLNRGSQGGYSWYFDINSASVLGANRVAAFAKGAFGFVDIDRYVAWKSGPFGNSHFAQILLPVESGGGNVITMPFNLQIIEKDCPAEAYDGYQTRDMGRGYTVLLSKAYGLWQAPTNAFQASDRLTGNNGSLNYLITNDCDPCPVASERPE